MTRFARARGSKASNQKTPEEATSWSELKNAMVVKNTQQTEPVEPKKKEVKMKPHENLQWASLGDDEFSKSISLIKQHFGRNTKTDDIPGNGKDKVGKKKMNKMDTQKQKKTSESDFEQPKKKKLKKDKGTKRSGENNYDLPVKKMKKMAAEETNYELMKNKNQKFNKNEKKFQPNVEKNGKFEFKKGQNKFDKFNKKDYNNSNTVVDEIIIKGEKIPIVKFQGFNVTLEDAERLRKLQNEMIKEGIPRDKLEAAIKLERRRAEKALSRLKKAVCFLCRGHGHLLSDCPNLKEKEDTGTGICYKCGSAEHSAADCKVVRDKGFQFAECFICKEQGHIARQCPDNPRGLYPNGGACRECGDVTHLKKDCPKTMSKKAEEEITLGLRNDRNFECLDEEIISKQKKNKTVKKNSIVKF